MSPDEQKPMVNRYLTEGICPDCHIPLMRASMYVAACRTCDMVWRSKRVAVVFPTKEDGPHGS